MKLTNSIEKYEILQNIFQRFAAANMYYKNYDVNCVTNNYVRKE